MRNMILIFLIASVALACKKDKVPAPVETNYYQSNGNFLILKLDDDLDGVYEFNLPTTALNNDSLPLYFETYSDENNNYSYLKFTQNTDTLFQYTSDNLIFFTTQVDKIELQNLISPVPYDSDKFQLIGSQNNFDYSSIWSKISNLEIVKTYRNSNPNSKIGINRIVINEYNAQLGFSIPHEKHLIYLVK
jgi:hypothetical protein